MIISILVLQLIPYDESSGKQSKLMNRDADGRSCFFRIICSGYVPVLGKRAKALLGKLGIDVTKFRRWEVV